MYCTNCGNYNPEDAKNCSSCGSPMNAGSPAQQENPTTGYQPYNPQQTYGQTPYAPQQSARPVEIPGKGAGIASLVLGIVSLVFFCVFYLSIPAGIAGIVTGCVSISKAKSVGAKSGLGVAGIVCSAIGIVIALLLAVAAAGAFISEFGEVFETFPY